MDSRAIRRLAPVVGLQDCALLVCEHGDELTTEGIVLMIQGKTSKLVKLV